MPFIYSKLPSTQNELKQKLQFGEVLPHLDFVLAHEQTAGRGRQEREWISPPGNLYLSVWLSTFNLPTTWIPLWASVCLYQTLVSYGVPRRRLKVKWPNDLCVDEKSKIAGILCEKIGSGVIIGLGVNLIIAPDLTDRQTVSLLEMVPTTEIEDLNLKFARSLIQKFSDEPSLRSLRTHYEEYSILQSHMALEWTDLQTGVQGQGVFLRYGEHGELVVKVNQGEQKLFSEEIQIRK